MVFLLRKKATATAHKAKEQELATKLQQQHPAKVVTGEALSAMSIQYDNSRIQQTPTYQQPGNASIVAPAAAKISSRPQPEEYQQPIEEQLSISTKDIYKQPYGAYLTAASSVPGSIAREGSTSTVRPVSSSSPVPPSPSTSGLMVKGAALPPLYEDRITQASTSASPSPSGYYASSYGQYRSPQLDSNQGQGHHRTDSASSASSYAASDTSDVLHNSVGTRSSSGGTTATTPGSHCAKDGYVSVERKLSMASTRLQQPPLPSTVERVPVPTMTTVIKPRPESQISNTGSVTSVPSPALSQTSSFVRKTASRYTLTDFAFQRTLGTGSFGRVHLVRSCHNLRFYAVKVLNKERVVRMKQVEHTNSEREMLERARHPFLVNLWGAFKDSQNLYMVMDFVSGGELFSLLRKSQRFPDAVAKFFAAEVALALDYLHSLDIIYRDLKPENILLAADGHIKITDFGFAKYVPDITWTLCGTPDYLAPEIVQSKGYNKSVDWYALGVLIFEMLAGYPPFFTEDSNPMRLYEKIIAGKVRYPSYFTEEAKDLLRSLLTGDLSKRFGNLANGSRDIFGHSYFAEVDWNRLYRKEIPAPYVPRVDSDGDSSNFDNYAEIDVKEYGQTGADPHGHLFTSF